MKYFLVSVTALHGKRLWAAAAITYFRFAHFFYSLSIIIILFFPSNSYMRWNVLTLDNSRYVRMELVNMAIFQLTGRHNFVPYY